jgi:exosortase H (IPTLxxWG-CTERM-specific)
MTSKRTGGGERPAGRSPHRRIANAIRRNQDLLKAYAIFVLFTAAGFSIVLADWSSGSFLDPVNCFTASASGWIINLLGGHSTVSQTSISSPYGGVTIAEGCNSVYVTILFLAGIFAFPARWKQKVLGAIMGTVALFVINLIRVVTLFYLSGRDYWLFQEAHLHIWQFLIILAGGLLWLLWYDKIVKVPAHAKDV